MQTVLDKFRLDNKVSLVTGSSSGIGMAMSIALAEAGADIIAVSKDMEKTGTSVKKGVEATGKKFYGYQCDFSNRASLYEFIAKVKADFPIIDILINNAGIILRNPIAEHSDEYWDKVIEINQNAQFILTREIGKRMVERGYGKIVFTASMLTFQGGVNVPGYTASKSAVGGLTKAFANEWASKGVTVNAIAPGYIATANTAVLRADEERSKSILDRIPAGRWGEPNDFTGPAVFLSSDASAYMQGTIMTVDGGWMGR